MAPTILAAIASLSLFVFILWLLRKGVLKEKYAVLWLLVTASALVFTIFPNSLRWISDQLGVEIPSNLLFFVALVILVVVSIQLSYELSKHEARIRRLAEEIALMKLEIKKLQSKNDPD